MGVFKKQRPFGRNRSEGNFGGGHGGFGGGSRGGFGGRDFGSRGDRSQLHDAVCAQCGKNCRVPFMPTSGKPVYCSDCFESRGNGGDAPRRPERSGFGDRFEKRSYAPSFDRTERSERSERPQALHNEKLDIIIAKLDKVLKLLKPIMVESPEIADEVSDIMAEVAPKKAKKSKPKKETSEAEAFVAGSSEQSTEEVTE